jgi:deoxyribose-phosphate aldolase
MNTRITDAIKQYPAFTKESIKTAILELLESREPENSKKVVYEKILGMIDLTSLNTTDSEESIAAFTEKVNLFGETYPEYSNVAAICVYPAFVKTVGETLTEGVEIAAVTGGFPHAQTFIEVKIAETSLAVMDGATEIDCVMPIGKLLEKKYDEIVEELKELKSACRDAKLKVILESGAISLSELRIACILAMEAGADFIKTSTGKQQPAATLDAAYCMCTLIAEYHKLSGRKVGFKAAGGIKTTQEAVQYYTVVESILGKEWLSKDYFRIGASSLANELLSDVLGEKTVFF